MYIKSIILKEDYRCLKKGLEIELNQNTILVGDQGCGKSSLLKLLSKCSDKLGATMTSANTVVKTYYFDTETMNPRVCDMESNYSTPSGESKGIGMGVALQSHFKSHGETLREFTLDRICDFNDCVVFLDEPESGLSLRNQYKLVKEIIKASSKQNVQFVIATHCLPIISSFLKVYSLEHKQWMDSDDFIQLSKTAKSKLKP